MHIFCVATGIATHNIRKKGTPFFSVHLTHATGSLHSMNSSSWYVQVCSGMHHAVDWLVNGWCWLLMPPVLTA
jgi:hypothetical protein